MSGLARRPLDAAAPVAALVAGPAEIIGDIEAVGVVAGDAVGVGGLGVIPADEIHGIGETGAAGAKLPASRWYWDQVPSSACE